MGVPQMDASTAVSYMKATSYLWTISLYLILVLTIFVLGGLILQYIYMTLDSAWYYAKKLWIDPKETPNERRAKRKKEIESLRKKS